MKTKQLGMVVVLVWLAATLPALRAENTYTEVEGGGPHVLIMHNTDHIDFAIQFNNQLDDERGVQDGGGIWVGYRHSLSPWISLGGKLGVHGYTIDSAGKRDSISTVPLLFTIQFDQDLDRTTNLYAQFGLGPSFNHISGDATRAYDLRLGDSLAFDFCFGGTVALDPHFALGLNLDLFLASAAVDSPSPGIRDSIDIGHFGLGVIFVGSF